VTESTYEDDDDCFYYHSWRNDVVIAFGLSRLFLLKSHQIRRQRAKAQKFCILHNLPLPVKTDFDDINRNSLREKAFKQLPHFLFRRFVAYELGASM